MLSSEYETVLNSLTDLLLYEFHESVDVLCETLFIGQGLNHELHNLSPKSVYWG